MLAVEAEGQEVALEEGPFQEGEESMDSDFLVVLEAALRLGDLVLVVLQAVLRAVLSQAVVHRQDHWGHWGHRTEVDIGCLCCHLNFLRSLENPVVRRSISSRS